MPQPLSSAKPNANIFIGNNTDSPARQRPNLALEAMNVVAEWSILEGFINGLFVNLLGANPKQSSAIFSTIRSQQGQRDAIEAVLAIALQDRDEQNIIRAIFKVYERASKVRNRICHWVWGHSPQLPDAVLLADPVAMAEFKAEVAQFTQSICFGTVNLAPPTPNHRRIYVYTQEDFRQASTKIQRAMHLAISATMELARKTPQGAPGLLQLSSEPEIHAELERLSKDHQSNP